MLSTVTVRGKANVTVFAFFGFSQLGGLGSQVGQITITLTFLVRVGGLLKCLPQGASDVVTPIHRVTQTVVSGGWSSMHRAAVETRGRSQKHFSGKGIPSSADWGMWGRPRPPLARSELWPKMNVAHLCPRRTLFPAFPEYNF